ncbi:hypothetical protein [Oceanobacter kriegii]|uniref:hypothetical protein n=1 Tax=Oceanobacter kriegii TaxID=64972 RepID=UPI0012EC95DA|nr:hypothetical protein [Oceanobacter kriegii]
MRAASAGTTTSVVFANTRFGDGVRCRTFAIAAALSVAAVVAAVLIKEDSVLPPTALDCTCVKPVNICRCYTSLTAEPKPDNLTLHRSLFCTSHLLGTLYLLFVLHLPSSHQKPNEIWPNEGWANNDN